jgi:hypothetical protein
MSIEVIAKFLSVNKTLYDGRDEGRWLLLPRGSSTPRYQLMKQSEMVTEARSPRRHFSFATRKPGGTLLSW